MIACLDVDYRATGACAAAVTLLDWPDAAAASEYVVLVPEVQPYEPGQFFKRELPCLLAVLETLPVTPTTIVIDGYVWLDAASKPGLGAHLHEALQGRVPVIGVAKTKFRGSDLAREILRGDSQKPLYITTAGIDPETAAEHIRNMHGPYRIPTLLNRVDFLCRHG